jgi:hypothetical protein
MMGLQVRASNYMFPVVVFGYVGSISGALLKHFPASSYLCRLSHVLLLLYYASEYLGSRSKATS